MILSIFSGIDLLGLAFELEGFCVVGFIDIVWGRNIKSFHPPAGVFDGIIGGPPCQAFSKLRHLHRTTGKYGNLIPEFTRIVEEAQPVWFLMENVPDAPEPSPEGYYVQSFILDNRWLGEIQQRVRKFWFGSVNDDRIYPEVALFENPVKKSTVIASSGGKLRPTMNRGIPIGETCELQGLPVDFMDDTPFTMQGKRTLVGNGVPIPMGRAIAKAIRGIICKGG